MAAVPSRAFPRHDDESLDLLLCQSEDGGIGGGFGRQVEATPRLHPNWRTALAICLFATGALVLMAVGRNAGRAAAGRRARVPGGAGGLLQVKVQVGEPRGARSDYRFDEAQARAFAALAKLTYCGASSGTACSVEATCGRKGFCRAAGVRVKRGSVRPVSLADQGLPNSIFAVAARLERNPWSRSGRPLKSGCVAAIRGTVPGTSNKDRGRQQRMVPFGFGACAECRVHEGYQGMWEVLMPELTAALTSIGCSTETPLYLTGHSLGGAVATIGMLALKISGWNVQHSYIFHNPKVGNSAWVNFLNTALAGSPDGVALTRLTYSRDNVPTWPWKEQEDGSYYDYTWPEVHYYRKATSLREEGANFEYEYQVCWGEPDCGTWSYDTLCKQSECDDHVVNPLAPRHNFSAWKDPFATCVLGAGLIPAGAGLPRSPSNASQWEDNSIGCGVR